jgi:preprotein translocase subunit SecG
MTALVLFIHVFVCLALIIIVLLQAGKGADMGAAFGGGGSQSLFGGGGATTFLSKVTTAIAILFMCTSLFLVYSYGNKTENSIMHKADTVSNAKSADANTSTIDQKSKNTENVNSKQKSDDKLKNDAAKATQAQPTTKKAEVITAQSVQSANSEPTIPNANENSKPKTNTVLNSDADISSSPANDVAE